MTPFRGSPDLQLYAQLHEQESFCTTSGLATRKTILLSFPDDPRRRPSATNKRFVELVHEDDFTYIRRSRNSAETMSLSFATATTRTGSLVQQFALAEGFELRGRRLLVRWLRKVSLRVSGTGTPGSPIPQRPLPETCRVFRWFGPFQRMIWTFGIGHPVKKCLVGRLEQDPMSENVGKT